VLEREGVSSNHYSRYSITSIEERWVFQVGASRRVKDWPKLFVQEVATKQHVRGMRVDL